VALNDVRASLAASDAAEGEGRVRYEAAVDRYIAALRELRTLGDEGAGNT
jgi:hypothetical protein